MLYHRSLQWWMSIDYSLNCRFVLSVEILMQFDRKFRQMKITKYVHGRQKYESHSQKLAWPCVYPNEKAETRGNALMRIINDLVPDQFLDKNKLEYPSFCIKRYLHGANRDAYVRTTPWCNVWYRYKCNVCPYTGSDTGRDINLERILQCMVLISGRECY